MVTGEVLEFDSLMDAHKAGYDASNIGRCCDGKQKQYRKFLWMEKLGPM